MLSLRLAITLALGSSYMLAAAIVVWPGPTPWLGPVVTPNSRLLKPGPVPVRPAPSPVDKQGRAMADDSEALFPVDILSRSFEDEEYLVTGRRRGRCDERELAARDAEDEDLALRDVDEDVTADLSDRNVDDFKPRSIDDYELFDVSARDLEGMDEFE